MNRLNLILMQAEGVEALFFLAIAILLAYGVGCLGRKRKIGFGWAFFLALINLLLGLIVVLCSEKKGPEFIDIEKER